MITKLNDVARNSGAEMVGQIATYSPGDKIHVTYKRDGKEYTVPVTFETIPAPTIVVKNSVLEKWVPNWKHLNKKELKELGVTGGVVVKSIDEKGLFSKTDGRWFCYFKSQWQRSNTSGRISKIA